jgi:phosphatidylglycerol---prolipoprotein diacylglyceryl transferase
MCPTLFFIPAKLAGYPLFGAGLLLAVWAVGSVGLLAWLVWRQGWNADTWGYVPILLLIGAIIRWVLPALSDPQQGLPIRGFGMMNMLGVIAGTLLAARRAKRLGLDPELVFSLAFWMLVPGIVGARAFYVIEYWRPLYWPAYAEPGGGLAALVGRVLNIAQGGLVVYGAFLGGVAGVCWFVRKHRLPLLAVCDLIAPSMVLGLAIGRIGCVMNGCCFGAVCDCPWAITFPSDSPAYLAQVERGQMYGLTLSGDPNVEPRVLAVRPDSPAARAGLRPGDRLQAINGDVVSTAGDAYVALAGALSRGQPLRMEVEDRPALTIGAIRPPQRSLPVHPTQIYSIIDGLVLLVVLLAFGRFCRRDGEVFALLMTIYPVTRFFIETLRSDEAPVFGTGMSISQNVSLLLLVCAAALWVYVLRQPQGTAWRTRDEGRGTRDEGRGTRGQGSGARDAGA